MVSISKAAGDYNIHLEEGQLHQLEEYSTLFQKTNDVMNLSAIRSPKEVETKHFLDSLIIAKHLELSGDESVLDLGTGGGFPGVPIKVLYPHAKVYFLDSVRKKLDFIRLSCKKLDLDETYYLHLRAEDAGHNPELRESMDVVVARAVAYLPVLLEYAAPLIKVGGYLAAAKLQGDQELEDAKQAMQVLDMKLESQKTYCLPGSDELRQVLIIRKTAPTDKKYPRKAGTPKKSPL
jgi:16S rRNA (guanine527-N7)-methyltransferase